VKVYIGICIATLVNFSAPFAWACDDVLKGFKRDCEIQDRYVNLREEFRTKYNVNINDIAEYKVIRFIDRPSWESAKQSEKAPNQIYGPAPMTWNVWSEGIDSLFPKFSEKGRLQSGEIKMDNDLYSHMNLVLLTNGKDNIKDAITDEAKKPGEFRNAGDADVGFCSQDQIDLRAAAEKSEQSLMRAQLKWEKAFGTSFVKLIEKLKGPNSGIAKIGATTRPRYPACPGRPGFWVSYVRSDQVLDHMFWMNAFIKANINSYTNGKPLMAPIEMAAMVQKWFVTVHTFADGNGRTSRAIQDMLLENFDLPFVPGGDLQNDAMEEYETYVENNYSATEKMLTSLEKCANERRSGSTISFGCKAVQELN
jgi:hypothetical protein